MRRWTAAGATLACLLVCSTVSSSATGGPPSEASLEALRERLITAYRAAPTIHRGYVIEVNGELWGRVEMYREGRLHGLHTERLRPSEGDRKVDMATDGDVLMARFDETSLPLGVPSLRPGDPRAKRFRAFLDAVYHLCEVDPPDRSGMEFVFSVKFPSAAEAVNPMDPEAIGLDFDVYAVAPAVPTWLHASVLSERKVSGALDSDLVAARLDGWDALLHASDGCLAQVEGVKIATGRRWLVKEVPAQTSAMAWRARIADLCRGTEERLEVAPPDYAAGYHLGSALRELHSATNLLAHSHTRRPIVEILCNAAWADSATSHHWWALIGEAQVEAARSLDALEPRAVAAARKQMALPKLIQATQDSLLRVMNLGDNGIGKDVAAQVREWIADRFGLLWLEHQRASLPAGER